MRRNDVSEDLKDRAFDLLYYFARFEYAMKAAGYLRSAQVGAPAEAGWDAFCNQWKGSYGLSEIGEMLIAANPKKQFVGENKTLEFKDINTNGYTDLERVTAYCRVVRNNLFHGGKTSSEGFDDPDRTKLLLTLCLSLLSELAEECGLHADYTGYY